VGRLGGIAPQLFDRGGDRPMESAPMTYYDTQTTAVVVVYRENCERKTVRLMRQFQRRPYFVPPMVEMVDRGWMFVSVDYTSQTYKPVRVGFFDIRLNCCRFFAGVLKLSLFNNPA